MPPMLKKASVAPVSLALMYRWVVEKLGLLLARPFSAVQAVGIGQLASLDEARQLVRRSFDVTTYEPGERGLCDEAYEKFLQL